MFNESWSWGWAALLMYGERENDSGFVGAANNRMELIEAVEQGAEGSRVLIYGQTLHMLGRVSRV